MPWRKPHETAGSANPLFTGVNNQPYHLTVNVGGWFATGSLWWAIGESHTLEPDNLADLKKVGEWNDMEVEMQGQHLVITFNGRKVQDVMLNKTRPKANPAPGLSRYSGRLGFLKRVGEVRFRKIEIKELSATKAEAPPAVNGPEKDAAEVDKLTRALLDHPWYYHDNLFPPGETFRFNADGTFHVFKWKYLGRRPAPFGSTTIGIGATKKTAFSLPSTRSWPNSPPSSPTRTARSIRSPAPGNDC